MAKTDGRGGRRLVAWSLATMCVVGGLTMVQAQRTVTLSIVASAPQTASRVIPTLRSALRRELGERSGVRVTKGSRYVLRATVTRLVEQIEGSQRRIECAVSVSVEDRGAIRAVLSGRATGRADSRGETGIRDRVVGAAVRGALRPLGTTLDSLRF